MGPVESGPSNPKLISNDMINSRKQIEHRGATMAELEPGRGGGHD